MAAQVSPAGPRAAGRFGLSLLSIGATTAGGFDILGAHWVTMEERAAEFGTTVDRSKWRLVGPMHIAETEEQARKDVAFGLAQWVDYFERVAALPLAPNTLDPDKLVDALMETGFAVVGTPEMAVAQIERLIEQSGGFGTFLLMAHEWADREATLHSYELFAREVMPHFQGSLPSLVGLARLGGGEPARVHRGRRRRHHAGHLRPPGRTPGQAERSGRGGPSLSGRPSQAPRATPIGGYRSRRTL